jgi:hypothetical protein
MFSYLDNKPIKVGSALLPLAALAIYFFTVPLTIQASGQGIVPPDQGGSCTSGKCAPCPHDEEQKCNSDGKSWSACSADACN